jgi:hypothetical protein
MKKYSLLLSLCALAMLFMTPTAADSARKSDEEGLDRVYKRTTLKGELGDVLKQLAELGDARVQVDWVSLKSLGVEKDTDVRLRPTQASVRQMLDLVLAQVSLRNKPLGWFEKNGAVYVTSQMKALRKDSAFISKSSGKSSDSSVTTGRTIAKADRKGAKIAFEKTSLENVLKFVRSAGKVNLVVNWRALEDSGIGKDTEISLELRSVTLATLLDVILEQVNGNKDKYTSAYWIVDNGIVKISTGTALDSKTVTKLWDIADLVHPVPDKKGPQIDVSTIGENADDDGGGADGGGLFEDLDDEGDDDGLSMAELKKKQIETLTTIIKESIGDDMWQPNGKGSITVFQNKLIITQTQLGWKLLDKSRR